MQSSYVAVFNLAFKGNWNFRGWEVKENKAIIYIQLSLTALGGEPDIFSPRMNTATNNCKY